MIKPDTQRRYAVGDYTFVNYVYLTIEQKLEVLRWRNQDIVRKKMYSQDIIREVDHLNFIDGLIKREDCSYWYITKENNYVGSYNVTSYNEAVNNCESGIFYKDTSLRGLAECISISLAAYELTFIVLGIEELKGFTKQDNKFMIGINNFIGLSPCLVNDNGYIEYHMSAEQFNSLDKGAITFRNYIRQMKGNL